MLEAASTGNVEQLSQLLKRVPVDTTDYDGWTALHFSSWAGRAAAVKQLLTHGANIHAIDKVKTSLLRNPMQTACAYQSLSTRMYVPQKSDLVISPVCTDKELEALQLCWTSHGLSALLTVPIRPYKALCGAARANAHPSCSAAGSGRCDSPAL